MHNGDSAGAVAVSAHMASPLSRGLFIRAIGQSGAAFGPLRAGPQGATMFEVMMGDPRSWGDEPETLDKARAEQGVEALPDVDLDYPPWLADLRSHWIGATEENK